MSEARLFGLWARVERDEMRCVARGLGVGVELHYLDMPTDELGPRIEARNSEPPWDSYPIRRADFDGWLRLGHSPQGVTPRTYTHVPEDLDRAVADRLDALFAGEPGTDVARDAG